MIITQDPFRLIVRRRIEIAAQRRRQWLGAHFDCINISNVNEWTAMCFVEAGWINLTQTPSHKQLACWLPIDRSTRASHVRVYVLFEHSSTRQTSHAPRAPYVHI